MNGHTEYSGHQNTSASALAINVPLSSTSFHISHYYYPYCVIEVNMTKLTYFSIKCGPQLCFSIWLKQYFDLSNHYYISIIS